MTDENPDLVNHTIRDYLGRGWLPSRKSMSQPAKCTLAYASHAGPLKSVALPLYGPLGLSSSPQGGSPLPAELLPRYRVRTIGDQLRCVAVLGSQAFGSPPTWGPPSARRLRRLSCAGVRVAGRP
jgi:hypothetical protein